MRLGEYFISAHFLNMNDQTPTSMITAMPNIVWDVFYSTWVWSRRQTGSSYLMAIPWLTQWNWTRKH